MIYPFIKRELLMYYRERHDLLNPLIFFALVVFLFLLSLTPDQALFHTIAPSIIWVAILLAVLLSLDKLFRSDFEDGSLYLLLLSPYPLPLLVLAKIIPHWLVTLLPLIIISPLLAWLLALTPQTIKILIIVLVLGTPTLTLIGAIAAALTIGLRNSGILLPLLLFPLYIPVLIFAVSALNNAQAHMPANAQIALLGALLILAIVLTPFAAAAALRISME